MSRHTSIALLVVWWWSFFRLELVSRPRTRRPALREVTDYGA